MHTAMRVCLYGNTRMYSLIDTHANHVTVRVVCAYVTEVSGMVVCTFNVPQAAEHYEHNVDNNICVCHAVTYVSLMPQAAEHYEHKVDEEQRAFLQDKIR